MGTITNKGYETGPIIATSVTDRGITNMLKQ